MHSAPTRLRHRGSIPSLFAGVVTDLTRFLDELPGNNGGGSFPIDIEDHGDRYLVIADLPGVGKERIDITMKDNKLTIVLSEGAEESSEGVQVLRRERRRAGASRTVRFRDAGSEEIQAALKDGVLTVTVMKDQSRQPRKIEIQ